VSKVDSVIAWAQKELGRPYVYGDEGPSTFDCSGLMQYIFGKVGISLPRTAHEQQAWAKPVTSPSPGDLVFYGRPAHHVGLYIGAGKMINAPRPGEVVQVDSIGTATSYGRVPGLGAAVAPVAAVLTSATSLVGDWLGGARELMLQGGFVLAGLGLLGYGVYRTVVHQRPSTVEVPS